MIDAPVAKREWTKAQDFWESGLLYYVNSTVLWPLGYALAVELRKDGSVKDNLRIMRLDPAETFVDGFPDEVNHPRHRATATIAERIATMSTDEQQRARDVLRDVNNIAAFLTDDPGASSLDRPDLSPDGS